MTSRQSKHRRDREDYAQQRIRWIDRLTNAIDSSPGAPSGSEVAGTVNALRKQLFTYREGFVHALNLTGARRR